MNVLAVRMLLDQQNPSNLIDLVTNQGPVLYRGYDWEIDFAIGLGGLVNTTGLANIASVTLGLYAKQNDTNAAMVAGTTTITNAGLTQAQWSNNTAPYYHGAFKFANSVTAITLNGAANQSYWLKIFATTSDNPAVLIPLGEGAVTINDGPVASLSAPAPAAYKIVTPPGGLPTLAILDSVTGNYFTLEIDTIDGTRTLSLGDTAY